MTSDFQTVFGSLRDFTRGEIEIINDNPKNYVFSNVFDVAARSRPYEKVVVAINLGYVLETLRAEGDSTWFAATHDEFAIVLDGEVRVELIKLDDPASAAPPGTKGTHALTGAPAGRKMGFVKCKRGHQVLLPQGAAYRFSAAVPGVILLQTIEGQLSVKKWGEICYS
ncbi:MAG: hydroxyquinol 1,2-dioxygenase [Pseudomonadota bacterium]